MAKDLNPRQLRFIDQYIRTGIQSRAFSLAGYHRSTRNALDVGASQLIRNRKVKAEIARRKAKMLKRSDITIEKLLSDAEEARKLAIETKQAAAATGAGQFQAKLVGLLIDRKEQGAPGDFSELSSTAEIIAAIRAELGEDAAKALEAMVTKAKPEDAPDKPASPPVPTAPASGTLN